MFLHAILTIAVSKIPNSSNPTGLFYPPIGLNTSGGFAILIGCDW